MKIRIDEDEKDGAIDLTPMIDVVFQLVVFFMLATQFAEQEKEMDVDLPSSEAGQLAEKLPDEIIINVLKDGKVIVDGDELDDDALRTKLARAAERDTKIPVNIRGDKDVRHERIVHVMSACGVVGLTNLQIGALEEGS